MTLDILTTVYIGNGLGVALLLTLFFSNIWKTTENRDLKNVICLVIIAGISCLVDPVVYTVDGHPGLANTLIIYIGNSWLYIATMLAGKFWINFIVYHLNFQLSRQHASMLTLLFFLGLLCLTVNIFYPMVFAVEENVYQRKFFYWVFTLIAALYLLDSVLLYYKARKAGGLLKFFPIGVFIIPVILGTAIQSMFYGISVIWTSVAIAIAGVVSATNNEIILRDRLTGLYNRTYLDYIQRGLLGLQGQYITGIMIDLNDFKSINDRFGHGAGDDALITVSDILRSTVGGSGVVIRYAGDEFVVLLNTVDEEKVQDYLNRLDAALKTFNQVGEKPYLLSASWGYTSIDLKNQSMNEFMNSMDKKMYENKAIYYQTAKKQTISR